MTTIRASALILPLLLPACADSGVVWSDHAAQPSAVERNRAMMMQNPADLLRAREASGRDGNRAADVLARYGRGEATGSAPIALPGGPGAAAPSGGGK